MNRKLVAALLVVIPLAAGGISAGSPGIQAGQAQAGSLIYLPALMSQPIHRPVLKWAYGGCFDFWCASGLYSSPATADLDGDGIEEILAAEYDLYALDGENGAVLWSQPGDGSRTRPSVVVADINAGGPPEILTAQGNGTVTVYDLAGNILWQKVPAGTTDEIRSILAADLDGNGGPMEVIISRARGKTARNTWVLDSQLNTRPGWPQLPLDSGNPQGFAAGVFNANVAAGDIDGDGQLEVIVPSDIHYINAFDPDGMAILANPMYKDADGNTKTWGLVGVYESFETELRGWGTCQGDPPRAEKYWIHFMDGPAAIVDLNQDGLQEIVVTGTAYDCTVYPEDAPSAYTAVLILNADRSRFQASGYDWTSIPTDTGAPVTENPDVMELNEPNPVIADLDGDGQQEILFASSDGRLHAFWLDKTEHGGWPYAVYHPAEGFIRFASEPVVADLNHDGLAEVIFTSWAQPGSYAWGELHILAFNGEPIYEISLPAPLAGTMTWNGAMAAPTLANVDADADLEVILNTAGSGVVVYDLPGTASAQVLWGTGRGNYQRTGSK